MTDGVSYANGYAYSAATGDLTGMTYPTGLALTFQRDAVGRISGVTAGGQTIAGNVAYLPFGPAEAMDLGAVSVTRAYGARYQVTGIQAGTALTYTTYARDGVGNITGLGGATKPPFASGTTDYAYTANRLVSSTGAEPAAFTYDNAGNITSDGARDFVYNQNNRLVRVEAVGTVLAEYAYDGFERRVKKVAGGVTVHYHYDLNGRLIAETDGAGNPIRDYVYLNGEPVAMKVYGGSAGWYWFINDHLRTPQKMVDESGSVVWAAAYAPFGEARVYQDEITNNLRFPGQYYDVETGLHYNWHRYYDPGTGRYLTPDPIGLAGGLNVYAYAENDPVKFTDPLGLFVQLMGSSEQQQYTLNQLQKFIRGTLSIGDNGMLSRRPCEKDEGIESDIDELIKSSNLYRVHPTIDVETGFGRSHTVPFIEGGGADIYFDPSVNARYATGFLSSSPFTPAAELAHEILGRATQIEKGVPHGKMGSETRRSSNHRAVQKANAAFIRMGMKPRTSYQR